MAREDRPKDINLVWLAVAFAYLLIVVSALPLGYIASNRPPGLIQAVIDKPMTAKQRAEADAYCAKERRKLIPPGPNDPICSPVEGLVSSPR